MAMLQLRQAHGFQSNLELPLPNALQVGPAQGESSLPTLAADLRTHTTVVLHLLLNIHNSAGIPIIVAQVSMAAGERRMIFNDLRPMGIEAYAHKPAAEQAQIAQRIWSRRAYVTIQRAER